MRGWRWENANWVVIRIFLQYGIRKDLAPLSTYVYIGEYETAGGGVG